jgi:hypothetical protein
LFARNRRETAAAWLIAASAVAASAAPGAVGAQSPAAAPADPARARQVLAAVRQALGGEPALAAVRAISLEGEVRRRLPGEDGQPTDTSGTVHVDALRPDHYLRVDTLSPAPGLPGIPLATGLDGGEAWSGALPVASAPNVVIRTAPPGDRAAQTRMKDRVLRESALFLVALLAADDGTEYAWTGEAEAPEGRADVLQVTGPGGLDARLFVDQKTHRPLMLTFREAPPRMMMRRMAMGGGPHGAGPAPASPEAVPTPPPAADATLFLSDWKKVGGVLLPHSLQKTLDGKPYEEIVVSRFLVNDPKLTADKFRKRV